MGTFLVFCREHANDGDNHSAASDSSQNSYAEHDPPKRESKVTNIGDVKKHPTLADRSVLLQTRPLSTLQKRKIERAVQMYELSKKRKGLIKMNDF